MYVTDYWELPSAWWESFVALNSCSSLDHQNEEEGEEEEEDKGNAYGKGRTLDLHAQFVFEAKGRLLNAHAQGNI